MLSDKTRRTAYDYKRKLDNSIQQRVLTASRGPSAASQGPNAPFPAPTYALSPASSLYTSKPKTFWTRFTRLFTHKSKSTIDVDNDDTGRSRWLIIKGGVAMFQFWKDKLDNFQKEFRNEGKTRLKEILSPAENQPGNPTTIRGKANGMPGIRELLTKDRRRDRGKAEEESTSEDEGWIRSEEERGKGRGGFGAVFKGVLKDGFVVAVKWLDSTDQGEKEFSAEGTLGYIALEWQYSRITAKADIYNYGVVLVEVVSGMKSLDYSRPESDMHLLKLLERMVEEDCLFDIVDFESEDLHCAEEYIVRMIKLGIWCLNVDHTKRPSMSTMVKVLEGCMELEAEFGYQFLNVIPQTVPSTYVCLCV
ncbi:hypothetical protein GIB67_032283 [Kingdonia uniflora]|uniref:Protein kinase domain-containing protein n=1 Tax=Kingdonia uniflora TaxID=39325 RepID=A0A7J7MXK3_9MAGN|nr:hypothetical protein GIB67_032283 [Kingdonia uniflora]